MKEIREQLDIDQETMALYFGVSRSHLSMIEQKTRNLPDKSGVKSAQMALAFYNVPPDKIGLTNSERETLRQNMTDLAVKFNLKIYRYEARLKKLMEKAEANQRKRLFAAQMRTIFPEPDEATRIFIEICEAEAKAALKTSLYLKIEELKIDIDLLKEKARRLAAFGVGEAT